MSDHKFEPFDRVLVRDVHGVWKPDFYGYPCPGFTNAHIFASGGKFPEVLPYSDETKHLLGTTQPYEPPKPPHEYKWGDRVEVMLEDGILADGIFCTNDGTDKFSCSVILKGESTPIWFEQRQIRPLEPANE